MQPDTGWSAGQRALLRFLERRGVLAGEPHAPADVRPTNADLFAALADSIGQQALVDLIAEALRIAPVDLATTTLSPDLVALVPAGVALRGDVVPVAHYDGTLELAIANPLDTEVLKSVEFTTGLRVRARIARWNDLRRAVADAYGSPDDDTFIDDVPAADAPADPLDLADIDDVHLHDPFPDTGSGLESSPCVQDLPPEPIDALPEPVEVPATVSEPPPPALLVVSTDVTQRVGLRAAAEAARLELTVFTMRDAVEAAAVVALGGVAAAVVDGDLVGSDGRPLWQALGDQVGVLVVRGGQSPHDSVAWVDGDAPPGAVTALLRTLLEVPTDD